MPRAHDTPLRHFTNVGKISETRGAEASQNDFATPFPNTKPTKQHFFEATTYFDIEKIIVAQFSSGVDCKGVLTGTFCYFLIQRPEECCSLRKVF